MAPPPPEFVASRLFRGIPDRVRPAGAGTQPAGRVIGLLCDARLRTLRGESGIPRTYGTCCLCLFLEKIPFNGRCISCSALPSPICKNILTQKDGLQDSGRGMNHG